MAIYNGTQKVSMSGVAKVYVGTQLVYQNAPVLESITLSGQTTSLNRGASFSFGGTVTAHYSNSSTANVTSQTTFSGYNMSKAGTYTVTASYTENGVTKTATYQLTVNQVWTTLWSGSSSAGSSSKSSKNITSNNFSNITGSRNIRITFTISGSPDYFYKNGTGTYTQPSSPNTVSKTWSSDITDLVGIMTNVGTANGIKVGLNWDHTNKKFVLAYTPRGSASGTANLTITKIECKY